MEELKEFIENNFKVTLDTYLEAIKTSPSAQGYTLGALSEVIIKNDLVEKGFEVKVGKMQFRGIGKAVVHGEVDGFIKIVADEKTGDLLGVHMIGPHVTDMISEAGLAKILDASPFEIAHTIHPHPTLSEAIMEAALDVEGEAIHS